MTTTDLAVLATDDYPADHLPYGVMERGDGTTTAVARIGDHALDLSKAADIGLVSVPAEILAAPTLNRLLEQPQTMWRQLRTDLLRLLERGGPAELVAPIDESTLRLPIAVADYVDFYSSIEHATNLGRLFRPDSDPLLPNWRHVPIGYHGRAGTVLPSGTPISRPCGQQKQPNANTPTFGPSERLDIELELGAVLGGPPTPGNPGAQLFGVVLINDWSARDIQAWEYEPLGPFLGKSFATSMSHWIVPIDALTHYWVAAPPQHPEPLPYLTTTERRNLDIALTVEIRPTAANNWNTISHVNASGLYWTFDQQIAHMTSNGATVRPGDLIATGTISGSEPGQEGSLIERTRGGSQPIALSDGQERTFLHDGDTVRLRGNFGGPAGPALGECVATIGPGSAGG